MNRRDIIKLVGSVVVVLVVIALIYRYLVPPAKNNGIEVVVPHPVNSSFNQTQLNTLRNKVTDYRPDITPTDSAPKKIIE